MSDPRATPRVNRWLSPWLLLWRRPGAAIEAALARGPSATPWAIAVATALFGLFAAVPDKGALLAAAHEPKLLAILGVGVVALASVAYYLNGWILNAAAHLIAGRGSAAATRAAVAWSSVPVLAADIVAVASMAFWGQQAAPGWRLALSAGQTLAALWSLGLALAMLARVQGFGRLRALLALLIGSVLPALAVALIVRTFLFQPFSTPSGSMAPTLMSGDYFFAAKADYGYSRHSFPFDLFAFSGRLLAHAPQRGDVVVFRHDGQDWVKRIVGLPGETVQLRGGRLYIDGKIVERRAVEPETGLLDGSDKALSAPTYEESLPGGAVHRIVQLQGDDGPLSNTEPFKVPQNSYFVLGDNRDNSMDSRMRAVGFVEFEELIGRANLIFYSRAGAPLRPRFDRAGTWVR